MNRFVVLVEFVSSDGGFAGTLDGRGVRDFSEVEVLASSESEAHLIASQMVACRSGIEVIRTIPSC